MKFQVNVGPILAKNLPEVLGVLTEWGIPYSGISEHSANDVPKPKKKKSVPRIRSINKLQTPDTVLMRTSADLHFFTVGTLSYKVAVIIDKLLKAQSDHKLTRRKITEYASRETSKSKGQISSVVSQMSKAKLLRVA